MPGNEVGDRICNFFEQDNSSQGHLQSHTVGGSWPVNYSQWGGNQRQIGEAISFNLKNFNVQQFGMANLTNDNIHCYFIYILCCFS